MSTLRENPGRLTFLSRTLALLGLWWILTEGDIDSWSFGLPASALCAWLSLHTMPAASARPRAVLGFLGFFLWRSAAGAWDVALRVLAPPLPIEPALVLYRTSLPEGWARLLFVNSISLTPGTLGADLEGDRVQVHLLDKGRNPEASLRSLEDRIAAMLR